ncbi:MAG TPA: glucokinase [Woeseiaceae bacterium]|nr:glucokinase [Woeseiaceae bacterium]
MDRTLLIGDIGGTNARFALATESGFSNAVTLRCADFASADDAIRHYLSDVSADSPAVICLAAAGPVIHNQVRITNNHWSLNAERIGREFGVEKVRLMNDFEAAAHSILQLADNDYQAIDLPGAKPLPDDRFDIAVVGPGTGFGAAGLVRQGRTIISIVGEGGHVGFAPRTQVQVEILNALRGRFDRVSIDRLVSGPGIENIYWALTQIHGEERTQCSAREIFIRSADGSDPRATESTLMFFELLGQVAGDFALTLGAVDGVYIAGGIAKRYPDQLVNSGFRSAFEDKGRHRAYMERIPTLLITHDEPGLLGAAYCALALSSS